MKHNSALMFVAALVIVFLSGAVSASGDKPAHRGPRSEIQLTTGEDITCFFTNPGERQTLRFKAVALPEGRGLDYEINDYNGKPTGQKGRAVVEGKALAVSEVFPGGYYEIRFPEVDLTFGVASLPPFVGERDPFYAIEGLLGSRPHRRQLVGLLLRGGICSNREWCHYPALEPVKGTMKTTRDGFYTMAGEMGFKSIFCFADFPNWYYDGGRKIGRRPPPRRLLGLDASIAMLLERRAKGLLAFHVLNEYDCYEIPGEAYVPTIKVAGYAMADNELPLVGAPFCRGAGASVTSSIANGLLDFVDVFSFHSYSNPEVMIRQIRGYREAMSVHPKGGMPIWVTESGRHWSRGLDPDLVKTPYGGPLGSLHPSPQEGMTSALWITMRAVEAKAGGVAKHFAFTLPFFQEKLKNFGMMDYHFTPLRSLAAYMHSIRELAGKEYVGDWKKKPGKVKILRVFGDGEDATAVLYTGTMENCTIDLRGMPWRSARSIDGRKLAITSDGQVSFTGGLAYLTLEAKALDAGALDTETEAMALLKQARAYKPVKRVSSPVIYQFDSWQYPRKDRQVYYDESNVFSVNVFNFGDEPVAIAPELLMPKGMRVAEAPPQTAMNLAPRSEKTLVWKLDRSECPVARYDLRLVDSKHPFSGVCVPFLNRTGLRAETFDFMNPKRWRHNSSGKSTFSFDEEEQAVKVSTVFDFKQGLNARGGLNYWVFPEYVLDLPKESLAHAVALSMEFKFKQGNGSPKIASPLVMFTYQDANEKGKYDSVTFGKPTGEWQKFTISIDSGKTDLYKMIRIGMCPKDSRVDYWMRNITLYYAR